MSFRDTATAIVQRAPGNFIGVVLYVPAGGQSTAPYWHADAFPSAAALEDWYTEIAPSHPLFYYIAAFDKTQGLEPAGETIAPIKPGMPGFDMRVTDRWRHAPYKRAPIRVAGESGGANHLHRMPGLVAHGVVLQNPEAPRSQRIWAYEVRWLRGQPVPSLPATIGGHPVRLVIVDEYPSPDGDRQRTRSGLGDAAKFLALFALFAIPAGMIISKKKERTHLCEEKAEFRRLGLDWKHRSAP